MSTKAEFVEPEHSPLIPLVLWGVLLLVATLWVWDTQHHTDCNQYPPTEGSVLINYADLPAEAAECLIKD